MARVSPAATTTNTITLLGGELMPFQVEAVAYIKAHRGRTLIADEVGLGKTVEALAWLAERPDLRPALVVCPASIKLQWQREVMRWLGEEAEVLYGKRNYGISTDIAIINYDILKDNLPTIKNWEPQVLVFDECHMLKEAKTQRSRAANAISQLPSVESILGLTGTPVLNRPKELWYPVNIISPKVFPNFWNFAQRYCNPKRINTTAKRGTDGNVLRSFGGGVQWNQAWDFNGASNLAELHHVLKEKLMIRRRKADVLTQLPEKRRVTVPFDCNLTEYNRVKEEVREALQEVRDTLRKERRHLEHLEGVHQEKALAERAEENSTLRLYGIAISEITRLKKEAAMAKLDQATQWIEDFSNTGEKLVVFTHHHEVADDLSLRLRTGIPDGGVFPVADGRTSLTKRQQLANQFVQRDGPPVFVAGLTAMGIGVDGLQHASSNVAFIEFGWSPAQHEQAEGRLFRTGQRNAVTSYFLLAAGTIEERIAELVDAKSTVTSATVGEMDDYGILESLIDEIIV